MTPKSFVVLAAAAVFSAVLAIVVFASGNPWGGAAAGGEKLIPSLADTIRNVTGLEVRRGDETALLERSPDGRWSLKSRGGYPVDVAKVRTLLVGLGQAELVEPKTSKADRYAALELEDPAQKGAKSRLVRLLGADGTAISQVVLGKRRAAAYGSNQTGGTYVRRPGNPQTWLTNVELDAPMATKDWVKPVVLSLDSAKINAVSIEIAGEQPLKIERSTPEAKGPTPLKDAKADAKDANAPEKADANTDANVDLLKLHQKAEPAPTPGKLAFVGFPADGKKLKDASAAEALARAIGSIDLEDVRKLDATPAGEGVSVVKVESADGLTTTLRLRKESDATWLSVTATGGEGDAKKAAEEIAARTQGWEFKIPAYKADTILKKRTDLVETSGS
ncbi:MAG: DUF4340 domain-containing protein [Hyphomicrobiaceae bacterium]|nr:DUF4340 domain-containing protein [Hyphomicrobiaceae bacterium]